ncbi:MAG: DUF6144 family protein [Candidatus Odinarchaeota archaeon]
MNSIIKGLEDIDLEKKKMIMEKSGEACALAGSLKIAQKIAKETTDLREIIQKANKLIPWCGKWILRDNQITSKCIDCGCPLVRNKVVTLNSTFCYCSLGWVRIIFETLLKKSIEVKLIKSIGFGDKVCEFVIKF